MADFVFNIAKGRIAEMAHRILGTGGGTQQANAAFLVILVASSGVESDGTLKDKDTVSDVFSGATDEATNTGYARKTLDETGDGLTVTVDDTNDWVDVDINDQTWTGVANDGTGAISDLMVALDWDTTTGNDSNVIPCTFHDFSVTPNGGDITAVVATGGFFRAS